MSMNKDTMANIASGTGLLAFLTDFQVILTTLVLVSAAVLNIYGILDKHRKRRRTES